MRHIVGRVESSLFYTLLQCRSRWRRQRSKRRVQRCVSSPNFVVCILPEDKNLGACDKTRL